SWTRARQDAALEAPASTRPSSVRRSPAPICRPLPSPTTRTTCGTCSSLLALGCTRTTRPRTTMFGRCGPACDRPFRHLSTAAPAPPTGAAYDFLFLPPVEERPDEPSVTAQEDPTDIGLGSPQAA